MLITAFACSLLSCALAAQEIRPSPRVPIEAGSIALALGETIAVYDVRDLTGQDELDALARDIVSDSVSMESRMALLEKYRERIEAGGARGAMQNIADTIRELVQPPLSGQQNVQAIGDGSLTLVGTKAQHEWVDGYLSSLRTFEGLLDVKATVYMLPRGRVGELLKGRSGVVLDAAELVQLRANTTGADMLSSPRLIMHAGHRGTLSVLDQTAYIKDYELTIVPGRNEEIADPVIDVIQSGLVLDVRAAPVSATRMALHAELTVTQAERPFPEVKVQLGSRGAEVTVQLPEVHTMRAKGRFDLGSGSAVVLGALGGARELRAEVDTSARDDREILVIIEVARVAKAPEGPDAPR
jgi:hypothetical protein